MDQELLYTIETSIFGEADLLFFRTFPEFLFGGLFSLPGAGMFY